MSVVCRRTKKISRSLNTIYRFTGFTQMMNIRIQTYAFGFDYRNNESHGFFHA